MTIQFVAPNSFEDIVNNDILISQKLLQNGCSIIVYYDDGSVGLGNIDLIGIKNSEYLSLKQDQAIFRRSEEKKNPAYIEGIMDLEAMHKKIYASVAIHGNGTKIRSQGFY